MIPAGYALKRVTERPDWLEAAQVLAVCSVSDCVSKPFAAYTDFWRHNDFWFFDSVDLVRELVQANGIDTDGLRLFYYEVFEEEVVDLGNGPRIGCIWRPLELLTDFAVDVTPPSGKRRLGYDVVTWSDVPECSPLSCNHMAAELATNADCLFDTFEQARQAVDSGRFAECEPGRYRIVAVYEVEWIPRP